MKRYCYVCNKFDCSEPHNPINRHCAYCRGYNCNCTDKLILPVLLFGRAMPYAQTIKRADGKYDVKFHGEIIGTIDNLHNGKPLEAICSHLERVNVY